MGKFIVEGRITLSGTIAVAGNKNEALPLVAASMLTTGKVVFNNIPDIGDVRTMTAIADSLGAESTWKESRQLLVQTERITTSSLPIELSVKIRASVLFASALLVRTGVAIITEPGGDTIGRRRLDTHFLVFKSFGAKLNIERDAQETRFIIDASGGLHGADLYLDEASVTATENAIIAAAGIKEVTTISNAASEPHVQGLCRFLEKLGVRFSGIGSNMLTIEGVGISESSVEHRVGADYIEAGSFIGMAAATKSALTITGVDIRQMRMILLQFARIGVEVECDSSGAGSIFIPDKQSLVIRRDMGSAIPRMEDSPWPGFPTDLMSILLVTATQSSGTCLIHEKMFESRLYFVDKLINMGAQIVLCDPHRAVIVGSSPLFGATISSPDIRAGMALLIAALAAQGQSVISNIAQIDRGYENIDARLRTIGAGIQRADGRCLC